MQRAMLCWLTHLPHYTWVLVCRLWLKISNSEQVYPVALKIRTPICEFHHRNFWHHPSYKSSLWWLTTPWFECGSKVEVFGSSYVKIVRYPKSPWCQQKMELVCLIKCDWTLLKPSISREFNKFVISEVPLIVITVNFVVSTKLH